MSTRVHGQTMVGKLRLQADMILDGGQIDYQEVLTTNGDCRGETMQVSAASTSSAYGKALYCQSNFQYGLASASTSASMPCSVLALESSTGLKKVLIKGMICNTDWNFLAGAVYVGTEDGTLTQSLSGEGIYHQKVGRALSANTLMFEPDNTIILT